MAYHREVEKKPELYPVPLVYAGGNHLKVMGWAHNNKPTNPTIHRVKLKTRWTIFEPLYVNPDDLTKNTDLLSGQGVGNPVKPNRDGIGWKIGLNQTWFKGQDSTMACNLTCRHLVN